MMLSTIGTDSGKRNIQAALKPFVLFLNPERAPGGQNESGIYKDCREGRKEQVTGHWIRIRPSILVFQTDCLVDGEAKGLSVAAKKTRIEDELQEQTLSDIRSAEKIWVRIWIVEDCTKSGAKRLYGKMVT